METVLVTSNDHNYQQKIRYYKVGFLTPYSEDQYQFLIEIKSLIDMITVERVFLTKKINVIGYRHLNAFFSII